MARLFDPFFQAIDGNGNPISGAKMHFYQTGTTTPQNSYSDSGLTTPNANPVVADSNGRFGAMYLAQTTDYKAVLADASDTTIQTLDPLLIISTSVISTQGDIIVGNSSGADSRLALNATNGAHLASNGTTVVWRTGNASIQTFTSGSGTYTTPANCVAILVRMKGGGGGGGGSGSATGPTGSNGGDSSFNSVVASHGFGGPGSTITPPSIGGLGSSAGAGSASVRIQGGAGDCGHNISGTLVSSGRGGGSGGGGAKNQFGLGAGAAGMAAATNSGGGGAGSVGTSGQAYCASGGGEGEYVELLIVTPAATYTYGVGAGGAGGIGTGGTPFTGGAGAAGIVSVVEFYT